MYEYASKYMNIYIYIYVYIYVYLYVYMYVYKYTGGSGRKIVDKVCRVLGCCICIFNYLHVDSLTYAFGWSAFLCRIRFCDTLFVIFF
jgi:hypothetical protein